MTMYRWSHDDLEATIQVTDRLIANLSYHFQRTYGLLARLQNAIRDDVKLSLPARWIAPRTSSRGRTMAEINLEFLGRQMERVLSELEAVRGSNNLIRRDQGRASDDLGVIKSELMTIHRELASIRHDMHTGLDLLDSRLRPLELRLSEDSQ